MLSIGIIGLPNVGKSTLFNALTKNNILAANYPFATIEPNTGIVAIPDKRLDKLAKLYNAQKITPATITFVDIAGLVAGASKGEGLGNQFLSHIRSCQAICHVVRAFEDNNVTHVNDFIHPKRDIETINTELILADLQTIDKHLPKLEKESRSNPKQQIIVKTLQQARQLLDKGIPLSAKPELADEINETSGLPLLTGKPVIYLFNINEEDISNKQKLDELSALVKPAKALFVNAKIESELHDLSESEAQELLESFGQQESGLAQIIHAAYDTLHLQSYLTAGQKEVRAWTIKKGNTAPQAAGAIHSDFERGFIAAEIVNFEDLLTAGSVAAARSVGKIRTEGKTYVMQPNDIVEFRFNV